MIVKKGMTLPDNLLISLILYWFALGKDVQIAIVCLFLNHKLLLSHLAVTIDQTYDSVRITIFYFRFEKNHVFGADVV